MKEKRVDRVPDIESSASNGLASRHKYSKVDLRYMNSLSNAMLAGSSSRLNVLLYVICLVMISVLGWAYFAELDERTRGDGRVIPSRQLQVVQNLEGGIVEEIHVVQGQVVEAGQVLVTIDDTGVGSSYAESSSRINELKARQARLRVEAGINDERGGLLLDDERIKALGDAQMVKLLTQERRLYETSLRQYNNQKSVLEQQLAQRVVELREASEEAASLSKSMRMVEREIELSRPLRQKQLLSELEFLQLEQKALEKKQEVDKTERRIEKLRLQIVEAEQKIKELEVGRRAKAMQELNAIGAEIDRMAAMQVAIEDRVTRTAVRSPVDGVVKQLLINTVGGVVRPGMDILEIVPDDSSLLVEAKIKPSDIAFLHPGLKAVLKFTAYDFTIYGGLEGEVTLISADTITDDKGEEFYLVQVKTDQNYLGTEDNRKNIIVGMTAQVDIITGKKTVMQYLMKPILRAKYNALRER